MVNKGEMENKASTSDLSRAKDEQSGSYPPSTSSLAFPEDPFSDPGKRSAAQQVHQPVNADSIADWARSTRFTVLNHFSHVTNVARNGAHNLLSSPLFQQQLGHPDAQDGSLRTAGVSLATSLLQHGPIGPFGPNDPNWRQSELAQKSGTADFDSAHVYLARWAKIVAEEGETNRKREAELRRANYRASMDVEESELGSFEVWDRLPHIDRPEPTRSRDNAISADAWRSLFDAKGRPQVTFAQMQAIVFQQGFGKGLHTVQSGATYWDQLTPRAECWSFLLGAQRWHGRSGLIDRRHEWNEKAEEYWSIKTRNIDKINPRLGQSVDGEDEDEDEDEETQRLTAFWKEQRHRIRVDCRRVDRKIPFFRDSDIVRLEQDGNGVQTAPVGDADTNAHILRLEEVLLTFVAWDQSQDAVDVQSANDNGSNPIDERGLLGGYVQGMSDLCAPLYAVADGDEAKTFWLLVGLMTRLRRNFYSDQSGMRMQLLCLQKLIAVMDASLYAHLEKTDSLNLFFCFRWLLVCFKREFDYDEILLLWEAIWAAELDTNCDDDDDNDGKEEADGQDGDRTRSNPRTALSTRQTSLSSHFQLFIALAMLEQQRDVVVKYLHHFDEILQYMNGLTGQIDVDTTIAEAQVFCRTLQKLIELQDAKNDGSQGVPPKKATETDEAHAIATAVHVDDDLRALVGYGPAASDSTTTVTATATV